MDSCLTCGGAILEPDKIYGYSGKICYCGTVAQNQIRAGSRQVSNPFQSTPPWAEDILRRLERIESKLV